MKPDHFRFRVRTADDRFACDVRATWRELGSSVAVLVVELRRHDGARITFEEAASATGLSVGQLRLQLRIGAVYAQSSRELEPARCPVVTLATGAGRTQTLLVIEGRLVA